MVTLVKLAAIAISSEQASFLQNQLVFLHLLYILVEKQPYLVSTSSYQHSVYCSCASNSNGAYKNHVRQNGR